MERASQEAAKVAVVVPVYNGASFLPDCLEAIRASLPSAEIVVADDRSTDDSAAVAARHGATVTTLAVQSGAGGARNQGVGQTEAEILCFVDVDVVVGPRTLDKMLARLAGDPAVAAVFGSYDERPRAPGLVSRFRNLLHHYVHQRASREASTFWAGCGAMRRDVFDALGGFNPRWNGIEDIELGYRARAAGHRILLDPDILCTHLKQWTLRSMVWTDFRHRAYLWSRLILERRNLPTDLNVDTGQRVSLALVALASICVPLAPWEPRLLGLGAIALAGVVWLNRALYRYLAVREGWGFAIACIPLHFLHFVAAGTGLAAAILTRTLGLGRRR